ncbi:MAG: hypothetical protein QF483_02520 [Gammaproteobacteria bacterium]|nr:hypothetical protein [Gammaproteobacteria bacterium]MDP7296463.1 hypothetical protein [Gammaproteobacteria bacterium]MDP7418738.1 hypothetical protein [Gammaproteobacteria bacterium]MDP7660143.1 hypothetical protein [Gammaproteobacteria bacterium]HJP37768.1 hypothetical protein [Gammaproteobacteria bacterium]
MKIFLSCMTFVLLGSGLYSQAIASEARLPANVQLSWNYLNDFTGTMQVHRLKDDTKVSLWEMGVRDNVDSTPAGVEIAEGKLELMPGVINQLVLVMSNKTSETMYFHVPLHQPDPGVGYMGIHFMCLCFDGVVYIVPSGKTWFRVVEIRMDEERKGGDMTIFPHDVIALTEEQISKL